MRRVNYIGAIVLGALLFGVSSCGSDLNSTSGENLRISLRAPLDLSAQVFRDHVLLQWVDRSQGEEGFRVERAQGLDSEFSTLVNLEAETFLFSDEDISAGTVYRYRVRAFGGSEFSAPSEEIVVTTRDEEIVAMLSTPTDLAHEILGDGTPDRRVVLTWQAIPDELDGYVVQRRLIPEGGLSGSEFEDIGQTETLQFEESAFSLLPARTYAYRVSAFKSEIGRSNPSSEAHAFTGIGGPWGGNAYGESQTEIGVTWRFSANHSVSFKVYRALDDEGPYTCIASSGLDATECTQSQVTFASEPQGSDSRFLFVDQGLPEDVRFYYRIAGFLESTEGEKSHWVSSETQAVGVPAAITGFQGVAESYNRIRLSWNDTDTETGYKLVRYEDCGHLGRLILNSGPDVVEYVDNNRDQERTYCYTLTASNDEGVTPPVYAEVTTLRGPPYAPSDLVAEAISNEVMELSWINHSSDVDELYLERGTYLMEDTWMRLDYALLTPSTSTYTDSDNGNGLIPFHHYMYRVVACNDVGCRSSNVADDITDAATPPDLSVSPSADLFPYYFTCSAGENVSSQAPLLVSNLGGQNLSWSASTSSGDEGWLGVSPGSGSLDGGGETQLVAVGTDCRNLLSGDSLEGFIRFENTEDSEDFEIRTFILTVE